MARRSVRVFMAISRYMSLPKMPVIVTVWHISGSRFAGDFVVAVLGIGELCYLELFAVPTQEKYCGSLIRVGTTLSVGVRLEASARGRSFRSGVERLEYDSDAQCSRFS
jgi:hypothetical protein